MSTQVMNAKFHSNSSNKYGDVASRAVSVTDNGRTDGLTTQKHNGVRIVGGGIKTVAAELY